MTHTRVAIFTVSARLIGLAAMLAMSGCGVPQGSSTTPAADTSAARRPTVLAEYEGVVPCADCPGIRMKLTLHTGTPLYHLTQTYLGADGADSVYEAEGPWTTVHGMDGNPDAIVYQLDPDDPEHTRSFMVVDDREILLLDRERRRIDSDLNHSLLRLPLPPDPLGGRRWMWVVMEKDGTRGEIEHPERYTIESPTPGLFALQADCNRGRGRYRMNGTEISVGPIATTFAMCAEGSRGEEFARLVGEAVRMEMVGDTLNVGLPAAGTMKMVEVQ